MPRVPNPTTLHPRSSSTLFLPSWPQEISGGLHEGKGRLEPFGASADAWPAPVSVLACEATGTARAPGELAQPEPCVIPACQDLRSPAGKVHPAPGQILRL